MFFSTCFTVICRDVQSCSASKVSRCKVLCIVLHLLLHSPHFLRICWWTSFVSLCSFHRVFLTFHVFLRIGWCEHLSLRVEAGKGRLYSVTSRHKTQAFHNEWGGERKERNFFIIWHFVQKYIFPLSFGGKNDKVSLAAPAHLLPSSICFPNML